MGYVHDTASAFVIPISLMEFVTGTWAAAVDSNVWTMDKSASDETATVYIPIQVPSNDDLNKGFYLESVEIHFEVETASLDALSAAIKKASMPADGSAISPSSVTTTYDSGHDTAAERKDVDHHQMTLTLSTPEWIDGDEMFWIEISVDAAMTSVYKQGHAIAKGTLRL